MEPCLWFGKGQAHGSSEKYHVYQGFPCRACGQPGGNYSLYIESAFWIEVIIWRELLFLSPGRWGESKKMTMMTINPTIISNTMSIYKKYVLILTCINVS